MLYLKTYQKFKTGYPDPGKIFQKNGRLKNDNFIDVFKK